MASNNAYIKISVKSLDDINKAPAVAHIQNNFSQEDLTRLVRDFQELGGGVYEGVAYGVGLIPERLPDELDRRIWHDRMVDTLDGFLRYIYDDLIPLVEDDKSYIQIDYDPSEWFADEPKRIGDYVSGRLYCLAHSGALQAMGFIVEGTGLADASIS